MYVVSVLGGPRDISRKDVDTTPSAPAVLAHLAAGERRFMNRLRDELRVRPKLLRNAKSEDMAKLVVDLAKRWFTTAQRRKALVLVSPEANVDVAATPPPPPPVPAARRAGTE